MQCIVEEHFKALDANLGYRRSFDFHDRRREKSPADQKCGFCSQLSAVANVVN
jgi:hypothetical protein